MPFKAAKPLILLAPPLLWRGFISSLSGVVATPDPEACWRLIEARLWNA